MKKSYGSENEDDLNLSVEAARSIYKSSVEELEKLRAQHKQIIEENWEKADGKDKDKVSINAGIKEQSKIQRAHLDFKSQIAGSYV